MAVLEDKFIGCGVVPVVGFQRSKVDRRRVTDRGRADALASSATSHLQLNSCENRMGVGMSKKKLNVGMIGSGFIGKVHSNAFRQVGHFFDTPYEVICKVVCGRNRAKLETAASQWGWSEIETDWRENHRKKRH